MRYIICVDELGGMLFNGRRQSRDKAVCDRILALSEGNILRMSEYSAKLFLDKSQITVDDGCKEGNEGDFCFLEEEIANLEGVSELYIFNWNRRYPADVSFNLDLYECGFGFVSTEDFMGNSHGKITLTLYRKDF